MIFPYSFNTINICLESFTTNWFWKPRKWNKYIFQTMKNSTKFCVLHVLQYCMDIFNLPKRMLNCL